MSSKEHKEIVRQEAVAWLSRLSDSEATEKDRQAFQRWKSQSHTHAQTFDQIARIWGDPSLDAAARHVFRDKKAAQVEPRTVVERNRRYLIATAACLLVVLLGAQYFDILTRVQADYRTDVGEQQTVRLPDQSLVTLNTQTAISTVFDGTVRQVRLLEGEAFFHVEHDPDRPFIVESGETSTRAVGTEFVVRHQPQFDHVTVIEGIVEVSIPKAKNQPQRLTAGKMVGAEKGQFTTVQKVNPSTHSSWRQGLLVVDDISLDQVIEEVRRYYPGTIMVMNDSTKEMRVTGTYKLNDPSKILFHLTKTFPLQTIEIADRVVILF